MPSMGAVENTTSTRWGSTACVSSIRRRFARDGAALSFLESDGGVIVVGPRPDVSPWCARDRAVREVFLHRYVHPDQRVRADAAPVADAGVDPDPRLSPDDGTPREHHPGRHARPPRDADVMADEDVIAHLRVVLDDGRHDGSALHGGECADLDVRPD